MANVGTGLQQIFNPQGNEDFLSGMFTEQFAMGGEVGGVPVEVEGEEVAETPMGNLIDFSGPKHEQGGIDVNLPKGTKIFSDRIAIDGKTMQERKKIRERAEKRLSGFLDSNPSDVVSRNTLDRTKKSLDMEEQSDLAIQKMVSAVSGEKDEFAFGGITGEDPEGIDDLFYRTLSPIARKNKAEIDRFDSFFGQLKGRTTPSAVINPVKISDNFVPRQSSGLPAVEDLPGSSLSEFTPGDITTMIGNAIGGVGPLATTLANRAGDTPNVNSFKNFGKDALASNQKAMEQMGEIKNNAEQKIQLSENASRASNRNSARSVNTLRALDANSVTAGNSARNDVSANFANQLIQLFGQQGQLENQQDSAVMTGEQNRDLADRGDRDAFYSNLGEGITGIAKGVAQTGKDLNTKLSNEDMLDIMGDLSKHGISYQRGANGKLKQVKIKK